MDGTARTLSYGYDADGNAISLTSSAGPLVQRQYDGADRIAALRWGAYRIAAFGYDAAGRRSSLGFGIDTVTSSASWTYDGPGRLQTLGGDFAGTASDRTLTFAYNPASQIVGRTISNEAYVANSAYDVSRAYSINGLNQYTAAGSATFTYDLNGNLTGDGTLSYVYDAENRLVSAARTLNGVTTTVATLSYDPHGRLWQVTGPAGTRRLVYDGDRLVEEYDPWSLTAVYVHGPDADEPLMSWDAATGWARRYFHTDHQGSIVALADDDGNAAAINAYDEWGIPNAGNQGRFGYTGQAWLPELGMWYYKARIYSPTLGRFLQTDPVGYQDQVNLYAYVGNDPLDRTDPSGLLSKSDDDFPSIIQPWKDALLGPTRKSAAANAASNRSARAGADAQELVSNSTDAASMRMREMNGKGRTGEEVARNYLSRNGYDIVASQLFIRDQAGNLRIIDHIVRHGPSFLQGIEVKYGSATRSARQVMVDTNIRLYGGTVVSRYNALFPYGTHVQFSTLELHVHLVHGVIP